MGKRRHHYYKGDELSRKTRRLERKLRKVRRKRRISSSSSKNSSVKSYHLSDTDDCLTPPAASTSAEVQSQFRPPDVSVDLEISESEDLAPEVLCILGDDSEKIDDFGPNIHRDIACRWTEILKNGLKEDTVKDILKEQEVPENLKLVQAPKLNPEIEAAVNENIAIRDTIISEKQNLLSCAITHIANMLTSVISVTKEKNDLVKSLSNTGKLLCHFQYKESVTRKKNILTYLNKEIRDNIKDAKHDHFLFGEDLNEKLTNMKAIPEVRAELRPTVSEPRPIEQSARSIEWRNTPPLPLPPCRGAARQTSAAGEHKHQHSSRGPSDKRIARPDYWSAHRR